MAIIPFDYPAKTVDGIKQNVFPSQAPLIFSLLRVDSTIGSITSGTNGRVRISTQAVSGDAEVEVGDFIQWRGNTYSARVSRVTNVIALNDFEVDEIFVTAEGSGGIVNWKKDYFLEFRFVNPDTPTDEQNAVELFNFQTRASNDILGVINANIGAPSSFIRPTFQLQTGTNPGLSVGYKIQFRESFLNNRELPWQSPVNVTSEVEDIPILLIHGSKPVSGTEGFPEPVSIQKVYAGFPFITSFFRSNVNDAGSVVTNFNASYFDISKNLIASQLLASVSNLNGVFVINESTENIPDNVVFARIESETVDFNQQYDPSQYDPSQYA